MGGDGGTISSSRLYLRGAGKACHTADHPSNAHKRAKLEDSEKARLVLSTCAISGTPLDLSPSSKGSDFGSISKADVVVCPYGKLYKRERVLEALLQRSQGGTASPNVESLGSHIRGMKDLHPVRFQVTMKGGANKTNGNNKQYSAVCPITGSDISSGNVPSFVIVRSKKGGHGSKSSGGDTNDDEISRGPNVLSESAIKEMGISGLQGEYGPFEERDMIRLAPPSVGGVFDEVRRKWEGRMEEERLAKLQKKKDKKRKRNEGDPKQPPTTSSTKTIETRKLPNNSNSKMNQNGSSQRPNKSAADEARSSVKSAVAHNHVLSNLFGAGKTTNMTEKQKRDALFTRNC